MRRSIKLPPEIASDNLDANFGLPLPPLGDPTPRPCGIPRPLVDALCSWLDIRSTSDAAGVTCCCGEGRRGFTGDGGIGLRVPRAGWDGGDAVRERRLFCLGAAPRPDEPLIGPPMDLGGGEGTSVADSS